MAKKIRIEEEIGVKAHPSNCVIAAQEGESSSKPRNKEPFLVFILVVDTIQENKRNHAENGKKIRISMMFERGIGGKSSLESFRQFLVNELKVREYFKKQLDS